MSGLEARAVVASRGVDLALDVAAGETVAVVGPNGAGKSTLLAVLAGLLRPDEGHVVLGGRTLDGLPPHDRGVALLAQDPLLFPHLTVLENVAFAPRARGVRRSAAHAAARAQLERLGIEELADRRPHQVSGGQAQRAAIARALAAEPELLLLDEPLAALDVDVAPALRQLLREVLAGRTVVLVTHDLLDALLLADRVVVVDGGRVVEEGPTTQVLATPRSGFAARLAGLNLVRGTWDGTAVTTADGLRIVGLAEQAVPDGVDAVALFRPSAVAIHAGPPGGDEGSPRNRIEARVRDLEPAGDRVRVRTEPRTPGPVLTADVTPAAVAELGLAPGEVVTLTVKATEVAVHRT
ncbi:ATP-binding cassette domain-containing protein [Nocardioides ultimimeridianus]